MKQIETVSHRGFRLEAGVKPNQEAATKVTPGKWGGYELEFPQ